MSGFEVAAVNITSACITKTEIIEGYLTVVNQMTDLLFVICFWIALLSFSIGVGAGYYLRKGRE